MTNTPALITSSAMTQVTGRLTVATTKNAPISGGVLGLLDSRRVGAMLAGRVVSGMDISTNPSFGAISTNSVQPTPQTSGRQVALAMAGSDCSSRESGATSRSAVGRTSGLVRAEASKNRLSGQRGCLSEGQEGEPMRTIAMAGPADRNHRVSQRLSLDKLCLKY